MIICFNTQDSNLEKQLLMPANAPFCVYEFDNEDHPSIAKLVSTGYQALSKEEYEAHLLTIDMTAYNQAIALDPDLAILEQIEKTEILCDKIVKDLKFTLIKRGIKSPLSGQFIMYFHSFTHYMEVQATEDAIEELDRLLAAGVPEEYSQYLSAQDLIDLKDKIIVGLSF